MLNKLKCKVAFILAILVLMSLAAACSTQQNLKLADEFSTYAELIEHSPIVVTATVVSNNDEFEYDEMTFAITEVEVTDCVRGDLNGTTLRILQTKADEDPYLKKSTEVLLFLSEYSGPVAKNAYVINGLYNGQFTIKDNALHEVGMEYKTAPVLKNTNLESVLSDVRNTEYSAPATLAEPDEDVESANNAEKALESQYEENDVDPVD